ncbi:MAG: FAD-dependent oxidoreductase [Acidobacteria bacterium]|nr:FAD-dependent oxidoreductase [Acidobacteriota bacterium]
MTLGEHMRAEGASPAAVELVRDTMWFGAAVEGGSALSSVFSDLGLFMGGVPFVLTGGNDQLPTKMADRLGRNIRYGVEVVGIRDAGDAVEVRTRRGDQLDRQQAERVICTIPATVLRTIDFDPVVRRRSHRVRADRPPHRGHPQAAITRCRRTSEAGDSRSADRRTGRAAPRRETRFGDHRRGGSLHGDGPSGGS